MIYNSTISAVNIEPIRSDEDIKIARILFSEYIESLGIDLSFQDIEKELSNLPGKYNQPDGIILIARDNNNNPIGCAAVRPLDNCSSCEMKRLYVRPQARGLNLGRKLTEKIVEYAKLRNYSKLYLDTLPSMVTARKLYFDIGFCPTEPYYDNPIPGTLYMVLPL